MSKKNISVTEDGRLTYCSAPVDQRGKGRCNHIAHQTEGQTTEQFLKLEIKENPEHLKHINQTTETCMAAINQNENAIEYVKD